MRRARRASSVVALAVLLGHGLSLGALSMGCGGPAAQAPTPTRRLTGESAGDDDEDAPRIVIEGLTLPEPPVTVDADDPDLEPIVREARDLLGRAIPTPEDELAVPEMRGFVDGRLAAWMATQAGSIRTMWLAMQHIDTGELGAHVVARAITGTTLLELARRIATLPLPRAVREDTTARLAIREALVSAARPILERATQALGACASAAVGAGDPTVDEWRVFCDAEIDRADSVPRPIEEPGAEPEGAPATAPEAPAPAPPSPPPDRGSSGTPR